MRPGHTPGLNNFRSLRRHLLDCPSHAEQCARPAFAVATRRTSAVDGHHGVRRASLLRHDRAQTCHGGVRRQPIDFRRSSEASEHTGFMRGLELEGEVDYPALVAMQ